MDYAVALMIYLVSIFGAFYAMYCMIRFKDDKTMVRIMGLMTVVFTGTTYIGGMMVQAIS